MTTTERAAQRGVDAARPRGPLMAWRTVDLVAAAMLGVAMGVAFWGWDFAWNVLDPAFKAFPPASGLLGGPWLLAGVLGALVVRRPGAALLAELVAANVEYLIGNQWGVATLISGAAQGVGMELALLFFAYRRFGWGVAALGGALAALVESVYEWYAYWTDWDWFYKIVYAGAFAVSGAVIAGVGGWLITRGLARTGALDAFPAGREVAEQAAA